MILEALPHTCTAQVRSRSQGTMAGGKDTWTNVFTNRACWRQPASDNEAKYAGKPGITISHKVYFTSDPGLDNSHRLVFSDGSYNIVSRPVPDSSVGLAVVWRVMLSYNSSED